MAVWIDDSGDDVLAGSIDCGGGIRQYGFIGDQNDLPVLAAHTGAHHAGAGDDQCSVDDFQIEHVSSSLSPLCCVVYRTSLAHRYPEVALSPRTGPG